jgi:gamma-glutamyltranspeptidase / glutathione hydrolase
MWAAARAVRHTEEEGYVLGERRAQGRGRAPAGRRGRLAAAAVGAALLAGGTAAVAADLGVSPTPFGTPTKAITDPAQKIDAVRGDRLWAWSEQTRSEVLARHGVVATSQPLAAEAGLQMLRKGGTAADAAVATAAMLGLVEPHSAGIGGDMEAIYWSAEKRRLYALNAAGWAPKAWTPAYFRDKGRKEVPTYGVDSVSVPGAVDGWSRFQQRFGSLSLAQALRPSIELARQGFGLTERIRGDWNSYDKFYVDMLRKDPESAKVFLRNGHVPALYSTFRNPHLARAYGLLAKQGPDAFYRGPIGRAIVKRIRKGGGAMTMADLKSFRSQWVKPISTTYKGYDVYQTPPQTQGFATLEMLNILEQCGPRLGYDLRALGARSPEFWHVLVEAKKLAYADLLRYNGDPRFVDVPLKRLLSKRYAASLCSRIDLHHASGAPATAAKAGPSLTVKERGDTVYLVAADRWGNMASFIYSIYDYFGSSVSVPGYGFPLNDRGSFFSLDPASASVVAPHKRPFLTIIPGFVMKGGKPLLAFGNMGGDEQAQAQATELVNMIDLGMNPQAAGDAARFHHGQSSGDVHLESKLYDLVGPQLAAMGHHVVRVQGDDDQFGGYQAVLFQRDPALKAPKTGRTAGDPPVNGVYRAASDFRKDGQAVGW